MPGRWSMPRNCTPARWTKCSAGQGRSLRSSRPVGDDRSGSRMRRSEETQHERIRPADSGAASGRAQILGDWIREERHSAEVEAEMLDEDGAQACRELADRVRAVQKALEAEAA